MSREQRMFVWIGIAVTCLVVLWALNTGLDGLDTWLAGLIPTN